MDNEDNQVDSKEDLPTYVVIIIGLVCGLVVIILTVILVYLCCKRRLYTNSEHEPEDCLPPKNLSNGLVDLNNGNLDCHMLQNLNNHQQLFTTETSGALPMKHNNVHSAAIPPKHPYGDNYSQTQGFDQPYLVLDDPSYPTHHNDLFTKHNTTRDSGDGSSSSDHKPKKIMYEVVV